VRTVFAGPVSVDYSQATIESDPDMIPHLTHAMGGRRTACAAPPSLGAAIERVLGRPVGRGRTHLEIRRMRPGEEPLRLAPEITAASAVQQAGHEDPLRAAIDTVFAASTAWHPDEPALLAEVRERLADR
jgi:hypothetical protein